MPRVRGRVTQRSIASRIAHWSGERTGPYYEPFLNIQNTPSHGHRYRPYCHITERVHHLLSSWEFRLFLILEHLSSTIDIREQYALLPLNEAIEIADALGVRYPLYPGTDIPVVLTSDFVVTARNEHGRFEYVRSVKPVSALQLRKLELLEIERSFWQRRGCDWGLVTDREIDLNVTRNIEVLRACRDAGKLAVLVGIDINAVIRRLVQSLAKPMLLSAAATQLDHELALSPGATLAVAYHLVAMRKWKVDLQKPHYTWRTTDVVNAVSG